MIHYDTTYERYLPEDLDAGEPSDTGWVAQGTPATYRDLVDLMAGTEPSQYPPPNEPTPGLFFTAFGDCDFGDGSVENLAYHPADNRAARYMLKAWRQANATSE